MTAPVLRPTEFPISRSVVTRVAGGMDGVLRVVALLRGRGYRVHDLAVRMHDGVAVSEIDATISLTASQAALLLARLHRLPTVVDAYTL
ncbi:hypothetical protein LWC35_09990 [Pseudonocardia kujensis]|uniref:hypothetical protein n=1 Tax=Pseudonocardia kujensis TaxID=1128675 RepID=UPI001E641B0B|nr:hypothetical protein [Pseudonocardia kujensis]MCE0763234.1 hypothetical protein [Pseudonocardia kujensis]